MNNFAVHQAPLPGPSVLAAAYGLALRELLRFLRQRTRIVGSIGQPVIFWVLFGAGLHSSFQPPTWAEALPGRISYQEFFFPGTAVLIVMFTAIFSTISIIEDRREGFLQGVLVAPVPRQSIVLGKVAGGTILALWQAGLFLLIGPLLSLIGLSPPLELRWSVGAAIAATGFLSLIAMELTLLGFLIAWPMNSTHGFHAVMSVFLMPLWLLSGSFFPGGDSGWLAWVIRCNPLTYGVAGLRRLMYVEVLPVTPELPSMVLCLIVTTTTTLLCFLASVRLVSRPQLNNVA